jgi:hypothetical protein
MELLAISLVLSFIFSFGIFLIGVTRKDFYFSLIGAIMMMLFSITCIIVGYFGDGTEKITLNNSVTKKTFVIEEDNPVEKVITLAFGIVSFIFSSVITIYSIWSQKNRESGKDE